MPRVELSDDDTRVVIDTNYVDRHLIKQLPGARYDGTLKTWHAPVSWATCVTLRGLFGDQLELGERLQAWAWGERTERIEPSMALRQLVEYHDGPNQDLYPFQRAGVKFLTTAKKALLSDPPGCGKTVQAIRALRELSEELNQDIFPVLIVCPNSVKHVWLDEFKKWWPAPEVRIVSGGAGQRRKVLTEDADVFIINYESLRLHSRLAPYGSIRLRRCVVCDPALPDLPVNQQSKCQWCPKELNLMTIRSMVIDEGHRIKGVQSLQTRAVWAVGHKATIRFALTGTPIANNPADLWAILHFLDPASFPSRTRFIDRYTVKNFNFFGGMEILGLNPVTRDELFKIIDPLIRRLPKEILLPLLPKKVYSVRYVEMPTKQERAYRQMEKYMAAKLEEEILTAPNPLTKVLRLMQFASAYGVVDDNGSVQLTDPSNKIDALEELLDELGDEPLVVFAASKKLINLAGHRLEKAGMKIGLITGDQPIEQRQMAVADFQNGGLRALLCTIEAAGEGLTMTRARHLVFLQRHWSAVKNAQAEDRVHRVGSEVHETVEIIDIISMDTVEERQREVLGGKLMRLEEIVRDREALLRLLGN